MLGSPGALGVSLTARPLHRTLWTRRPGRARPRMVGLGLRHPERPAAALPIAEMMRCAVWTSPAPPASHPLTDHALAAAQ